MTYRRLFLTALVVVLLSSAGPLMAKTYTVDTTPVKGGRVHIDGNFVGIAPVTVNLKLKKNQVALVSVEKPGAVSHWPKQVGKSYKGVILVRLEVDESFVATVESAIANRWLTVEAKHTVDADGVIDEGLAWQKIVSVVTDRFSDLEQVDRGSFYLRSAWRQQEFPFQVLRHRIVVKRGVGQDLTVKIQLESQKFMRMKPTDPVDPNKFQPHPRIFREDGETVDFLRDQL